MHRRVLCCVACLLFVAIAAPLSADSEYWVSVGSYRDLTGAEAAQNSAGSKLTETFTVVQAETDTGLWYRVQCGPYLTREIADDVLGQAKAAGFESAWILMSDSGTVTMPMTDGYDHDLLEQEPDLGTFDPDAAVRNVPEAEPVDIPGFNAPVREEREVEHKLIDQAPPGYKLNRLPEAAAKVDDDGKAG